MTVPGWVGEDPVYLRVSGKDLAVGRELYSRLVGPKPPEGFESNGCSLSPDWWREHPLWPGCHLHDWHYSEAKPLGWTAEARGEADRILKRNIRRLIRETGGPRWRASLVSWLYYGRVRVWGVRAWTGEPGLLGRIAEAWL